MMSRPTVAKVVHLQLAIAFAAHRLCTLHLHTSHDKPCDVTVDDAMKKMKEKQKKRKLRTITTELLLSHVNDDGIWKLLRSRHTLQYVGR